MTYFPVIDALNPTHAARKQKSDGAAAPNTAYQIVLHNSRRHVAPPDSGPRCGRRARRALSGAGRPAGPDLSLPRPARGRRTTSRHATVAPPSCTENRPLMNSWSRITAPRWPCRPVRSGLACELPREAGGPPELAHADRTRRSRAHSDAPRAPPDRKSGNGARKPGRLIWQQRP